MIFTAFARAVAQLRDPRFLRVLALGLGLTVGLLVAITTVFLWFIGLFIPDTITIWGLGEVTWLSSVASAAGILLMMFLSIFLMVPVASAFTGFFLDEVAEAVEEKHYPHLTSAKPVPLGENIRESLSFLGVMILANLLALILYFTPLAPVVFWGLNGFLLGREYFFMVAVRHLGRDAARKVRARHMPTIWVAGILMVVPLSLPVINLLIPILGVATFTHLFHLMISQESDERTEYPASRSARK